MGLLTAGGLYRNPDWISRLFSPVRAA